MPGGGLVLVTGGAGYVGSRLVELLTERGVQVRSLDIHEPHTPTPGVEYVQADVRDAAAVRRACAGVDAIHHNVALVPLAKDRDGFWSVNVAGTRNVLDAAVEHGVRKMVHVSTSAVYGIPATNPVTERTTPTPQESYGRAKLYAEQLVMEYRPRGLDVTIVRPRTILGHGRLGLMQVLFEWIRGGDAVPVLGGGRNRYQFVHVDDLVDACLAAADRPGATEYNIGAAEFGTMRESLEGLARHAGTGSRVVSVPRWPAEAAARLAMATGLAPLAPYHALMYGRSMWFDVSKAREELGYRPKFGNVAMLCATYDWYLAHRDEVLARRSGSHHSRPLAPKALSLVPRLLAWWPGR